MDRKTAIVFMASSRSGLGHIRRAASIARAIKARRPNLGIGLFTNAVVAGLTVEDMTAFDRIEVIERSAMMNQAAALEPLVIVADTMAPEGIEGSRAARALILREMPQERLGRLRLPAGAAWDLVLVPNPARHWTPALEPGFARTLSAAGWIYRKPLTCTPQSRANPLLLIAAGGGGTSETAAKLAMHASRILALCRDLCPCRFEAVQALGPRAQSSARISGVDRIIDPGGNLNEHFANADAVISTAGYNSVLELAITSTPALLIPIARALDDQAARTADWGPRLGAAFLAGNTEDLARWLAEVLERRLRRPEIDIGPSGADNAAGRLLDLMQ